MLTQNLVIIEDNELIGEYIRRILLANFGGKLSIFYVKDPASALALISHMHIHVFLIDIELYSNLNGIQLAQMIRKNDHVKDASIIFQTADANSIYALANEIHFYGYLVKPYNAKQLVDLFSKLLRSEPNEILAPYKIIEKDQGKALREDGLFEVFLNKNMTTHVKLSDIVCLEAINKKIIFHMVHEQFETYYMTLEKFLLVHKEHYFLQCHKSYVINTHYVSDIYKGTKIFLKRSGFGIEVPVGRKYAKILEGNLQHCLCDGEDGE